jgi:hypothetical protein
MTEKIYIQVDNEVIEVTGKELEKILATQSQMQQILTLEQTEKNAKNAARESALAKLEELGLTEEEIAAL